MQITVKYFGMLAEATGCSEEVLTVETDIRSAQLVKKLHARYDFLATTTYKMVVNQVISQDDVVLDARDEIALLPPFAGG